jgi:hypothetical protein
MRSPRPTDTPLIKGGRGDRARKLIVSLIATSYLDNLSLNICNWQWPNYGKSDRPLSHD